MFHLISIYFIHPGKYLLVISGIWGNSGEINMMLLKFKTIQTMGNRSSEPLSECELNIRWGALRVAKGKRERCLPTEKAFADELGGRSIC